jgi:hypothetical protein
MVKIRWSALPQEMEDGTWSCVVREERLVDGAYLPRKIPGEHYHRTKQEAERCAETRIEAAREPI